MKNTKNDLTLGSVVALLARIAKLDSEVSALTTERDELRVKLATKDERIAELETDWRMKVSKIIQLEQQLAALQAKREPLSDAEIDKYFLGEIRNVGTARAFARAIEAAHGIGTNHD